MDKPTMLIPQVHYDMRHWTVRITVTEDIATLTCNTGMRLKRYFFTDDEGNQITAAIFGLVISVFTPILQLFKVYEITNA
ncbi:hypothetical protein LIER_28063 [Lithospermum erythrorhizon]|uniref:Uncharacterized protein n=1 Tax=Lithospermum erythrorhizon TaxID=34254 RepID=A0AAV3REL1_LITER